MSKKHILKIKKELLPQNTLDAQYIIIDYFSGFKIDIFQAQSDWLIELKREDFTYCENFVKYNPFKIDVSQYNDFYFFSKNLCLCLSESWISYAWSNYIAQNHFPDHLTIIHIDDHADLMSPFIIQKGNKKFDMLTQKQIEWSYPSTVKAAIHSGAITIGSALTPIIMSVKHVNVLHIKQNTKTVCRQLVKASIPDDLLFPEEKRLLINLDNPCKSYTQDFYLKTSKYSLIREHIQPNSRVIVHIDMDYFNNRYNGSTSWKTDGHSFDPAFHLQVDEMKKIGTMLRNVNLVTPIIGIYIGISPSFYPVEFWDQGLRCLLEILSQNDINVSYLKTVLNQKLDRKVNV